MPSSLQRVHEFLRSAITQFPFWTDDLKPRLEETLSKYLGRQAAMDLQPSVDALEEWLTDQLVVAFAIDVGGPITPLEKMGQGWQSLVRIAALDVLRQYPEEVKESVVLLYEEPETYLHPHLSRKLRAVLDDLAGSGWTVICSTHSPDFVSFRSNQSIVRLRREGEAVASGALLAADVSSGPKFQELLDERGNHELLFGNRVVLCEGKDDVVGLRHYLEESGADLDGRSVSVVDLGGVSTLPQYARMASDLGIPWCGLTDEDLLPDGSIKPVTEKARDQLKKVAGPSDLVATWQGDLETCLGILPGGKATPEWQANNLLGLDRGAIDGTHPSFATTCGQVLAWILGDDDDATTLPAQVGK